jgi:hypothetical protein
VIFPGSCRNGSPGSILASRSGAIVAETDLELGERLLFESNAQNRMVGKGGKLSLPSTAPDSLTKYLRNPLMGRRRSASVVYLRRPFAPRGVPELNPDELRHSPIIANQSCETSSVIEGGTARRPLVSMRWM